jgi:hypothetical protein
MATYPRPPIEEDVRHDDFEYNPAVEPRKSKAWLNLLLESEKAYERWNDHCDRIDKIFASLERLGQPVRDKEFQMMWANIEVIKPSIYARPPKPVVVPKFKDRRPVYQSASEVLERCATVALDQTHINDLMMQVRDDLVLIGRGVFWLRYEAGRGGINAKRNGNGGYGGSGEYYDHEKVCIDYKHRRDFLHSVSRCWYEVTWVAAASYLTRSEARARFYPHSGDAYQEAEYKVDKDSKEVGGADERERAKFWEIWHKPDHRVVWVAQGCEDILDEGDPHLELTDFFPCPRPALGTCQRGSLIPVPDPLQYKDQLDEVNLLTARLHALSDALEVKGFYPAGGSEVADAIETALKIKTPSRVMVPVNNWAAFGGSKEVVIWLPIEQVAQVITQIIAVRKQIIDDIYQITGLSDIMRGATDARETLGAQQLKTQFGSSRIKDKQNEMVRIARDIVVIISEIITEKFSDETIVAMSQTQLPRQQEQQQKIMGLSQQLQQIMMQGRQMVMAQQQLPPPQPGQSPQPGQPPQPQQPGSPPQQQDNSQQLQQLQQQGQMIQGQIDRIAHEPNVENVLGFLRDNRAKCFVLDIETDSTIMIDEKSEKEARTEFTSVLGQLLPQLAQLISADPGTAEFCGEVLKFATAPFRVGRSLDGTIDELVEQMKQRVGQGRGEDPTTATNKTMLQIETIKQQRQKAKDDADTQLKMLELQMKDQHEKMKIESAERIKGAELASKQREDQAKAQQTNIKAMAEREKAQMDILGKQHDMQLNEQKAAMAVQAAQAKQKDMEARQSERQAAQQFKQQQQQRPANPGF